MVEFKLDYFLRGVKGLRGLKGHVSIVVGPDYLVFNSLRLGVNSLPRVLLGTKLKYPGWKNVVFVLKKLSDDPFEMSFAICSVRPSKGMLTCFGGENALLEAKKRTPGIVLRHPAWMGRLKLLEEASSIILASQYYIYYYG